MDLSLSHCSGLDLEAMRALSSLPCLTQLDLTDNPGWHPDSLRWLFNVRRPSGKPPASVLWVLGSGLWVVCVFGGGGARG